MRHPLALALGGGGARGALQAGALRALLEANIQPDILVGTSVGAVNATHLALYGFTEASLDLLQRAWHDAATADLLPSNYLWLTVRALFNRFGHQSYQRIYDFFVAHGVSPDLHFGDIEGVRLILVATDLNAGSVVLYGTDPHQLVLEGLLASTALPPWVRPLERNGRFLMDGGVVSNLPIGPALSQGAREIVALDLSDPRDVPEDAHGVGPLLSKLMNTIACRQTELEMALAQTHRVPVHHIPLLGSAPVPIWDFRHTDTLMREGYHTCRRYLATLQTNHPPFWRRWLAWWFMRRGSRG